MGHGAWGIISLDRSRVFPNPEIPPNPLIKGDLGVSRLDCKRDLLWV
jgi:hypothetical protein